MFEPVFNLNSIERSKIFTFFFHFVQNLCHPIVLDTLVHKIDPFVVTVDRFNLLK